MSDNQFPIGQRVNLPGHFSEPVVLEGVRSIGQGFECRVRLLDGTPDEAILSLEEATTLFGQVAASTTEVHPVDAEKARLLIESARIRLAYAHDRHFAVSLSGIRTLPHQIEAVYLRMLPQPRLRFLLADDPGADCNRSWSSWTPKPWSLAYERNTESDCERARLANAGMFPCVLR